MRQVSITEMIRRSLRDQYDAVLTEPLPRRWVDLINRLGQQEGKAPQPKADPDQRAIEVMLPRFGGHPNTTEGGCHDAEKNTSSVYARIQTTNG